MDPLLPALVGAGVGLIGAIVGAVATALVGAMTIRAGRKDAEKVQRRNDAVAVLNALVRYVKARGANQWQAMPDLHSIAVVAVERLLISAPRRDFNGLQRVTRFALESINPDTNPNLAAAGIEASTVVLRGWCQGRLKGDAIADAYGPALDAQLDAAEARTRAKAGA